MFIALPVEVFVERPCKDVIRTDGIEQRHRGTKLERIYAWQYVLNLTAFYAPHRLRGLAEPKTQGRMCKIRFRLICATDSVV